MKKQQTKAFTLVELIIVITILAILATIGFMSFQSYTMDARDANRATSIKSAQDGLEIYRIKKSTYPTPDNSITLTGGNTTIFQGVLGKTVADTIKLMGGITDPSTNNYYVYSTSGNGKYYQIRADLENTTAYKTLVNTTYAEGTKALVKGNYSFDPSLPSLITVSGNVNTSSGIFDPNVCFVIDGGTNLVTSNSTTCTQKKNMSLKDFDTSLVAYWDMESLTGTMLKDLSGNGNDGVFSGGMNYITSLTGGVLGKGLNFNGNLNYLQVLNSNSLNPTNLTISTTIKHYGNGINSNYYPRILGKGGTISSEEYALWYSYTGSIEEKDSFSFRLFPEIKNANQVISNNKYNNNINNFINISFTYDGINTKMYVNGKLDKLSNDIFLGNILSSTRDLYIGNTSRSSGLNRAFYGIIDDVKIYNRALSDSEIAQHARIAGF